MKQMIRKTVVIGLGGTGLRTVLHVKRKLLSAYGKIPHCFKFLVLDTADQEPLQYGNESYSLEGGEFIRLMVEDPATFLDVDQTVKNWFPTNVRKRDLVDGAGQMRSLGRLGMYFHAEKIYNRIDDILEDVNNYQADTEESEKYTLGNETRRLVVIAASLAGGTGSGTLLEIGHIVKSMLRSTENVIGMFLLPDAFRGSIASKRVLGNTYAAFKELDHIFRETTGGSNTFSFGGKKIETKYDPFDRVLLINNAAQETTYVFDDMDSLFEQMASGIIVASGAAGKKDRDIWDNLKNQLGTDAQKRLGQSANYCGFGLSQLVFDFDGTIRHAKARAATSIIDHCLLQGGNEDTQTKIDTIIDRLHIREEEENNQVIDRILSFGDVQFPSQPESSAEIMMKLLRKKDQTVEAQTIRMREVAQERTSKIREEALLLLDSNLKELLEKESLQFVDAVLKGLLAQIKEYQSMMIKERLEHEKQLDILVNSYTQYDEEAKLAAKRFFGGDKARERVIVGFLDNLTHNLREIMEIERRKCAREFYESMVDELASWCTKLERSLHNINILRSEMYDLVSKGISSGRSKSPFVKYVPFPAQELSSIRVGPEDFRGWMKTTKGIETSDILVMSRSDLKSIFFEFADTIKTIAKVAKSTIEDVLQMHSEEKRWEFVKKANELAAPMWQYNPASIRTQGQDLAKVSVFTVYNPSESILGDSSKVKEKLSLAFDPNIVANGDRYSIFCFKIEAKLPAYALSRFDKYREAYDREEEYCTFHIGKDFWGLEDIGPITTSEESRIFWSIGHADVFGLFKKVGSTYYLRSKEQGKVTDDYFVKLCNGRVAAMKKFLGDDKLLEEAEREIRLKVESLGSMEVARRLGEHQKTLLETSANSQMKSDLRELLSEEVEDVGDYKKELEVESFN